MKELTKAEEQIMQILWKLKKGFVKDVLEQIKGQKPSYNTVSTIIRILEKKGFIAHNAYGKTHEYYPLVSKREYTRYFFKGFMTNYFGNSFQRMVSFFSKEENLSLQQLEELRDIINSEIEQKQQNHDNK